MYEEIITLEERVEKVYWLSLRYKAHGVINEEEINSIWNMAKSALETSDESNLVVVETLLEQQHSEFQKQIRIRNEKLKKYFRDLKKKKHV